MVDIIFLYIDKIKFYFVNINKANRVDSLHYPILDIIFTYIDKIKFYFKNINKANRVDSC